jgi:GH25 family lysozyme M1 (1,4-beta-N-acetylmuramidase)
MTDPTGPRWAADTPEALEWQAIADRHARHLAEHGHPIPQGEAEAEQLRAAHVRELAALSTSGVLFGPDCSQYQGRPAWGTVYASGCRLGFYKGTEGRTFEDSSHQYNRAAVKAAGLVPGVYHFLYYSDEYATNPSLWAAQARWFVSRADPDALHFLDVEAAAAAGHHLGVREWVTEYRRLLPGHALGLYANRSLWANRSRVPYDPAGLFDYVWHAGVADGRYTTATGSIAAEWAATSSLSNSFAGKGYPECRLWQITDHAQVAGVSGTCDGNGFQGTLAELRALITTGTGDDSMSAEDVAALKAYIDSKIGGVPAAVWSYPVGSAWEDDPGQTAGKALRSAQRYAIYGRPRRDAARYSDADPRRAPSGGRQRRCHSGSAAVGRVLRDGAAAGDRRAARPGEVRGRVHRQARRRGRHPHAGAGPGGRVGGVRGAARAGPLGRHRRPRLTSTAG